MAKIIYMHKFPNGKIYIGQTNNSEKRWNKGTAYEQKAMKKAINKYGWENVEHIILEENVEEQNANERENYYIRKYESYKDDVGYNVLYNNKCYRKIPTKTNIYPQKNKEIKIKLCEEDYNYFKDEALKHHMNMEKYIYLKLIEEKTKIRFFN